MVSQVANIILTKSNEELNKSISLGFGIAVVILNVIEITVICRLKRKKIYEILLLSLSFADLLFGVSNSILSIMYLSANMKYDSLEVTYTTYFYFITTSILHLTWITLDRLWAVISPLKHKVNVTRKRTIHLIIATWIFTTIAGSSILVYDRMVEAAEAKENKTTTSTVEDINVYEIITQRSCSVMILITDIVFIFSYISIVFLLKRKKNIIRNASATAKNNQLKPVVVCTVLASVFAIFTIPYAVTSLTTGVIPLWANILLVSNSGLNSIVYCFRGKYEHYLDNRRRIKKRLTQQENSTHKESTKV